MLFNRSKKFEISEEVFMQIKEELQHYKSETERLSRQANYNHLVRELELLQKENSSLKTSILSKDALIANLNNTLENERHTARLILKTLNETNAMCEDIAIRAELKKATKTLHKCDFYA